MWIQLQIIPHQDVMEFAMLPFHHHHRIPINNSKDEIVDIDTDN